MTPAVWAEEVEAEPAAAAETAGQLSELADSSASHGQAVGSICCQSGGQLLVDLLPVYIRRGIYWSICCQ